MFSKKPFAYEPPEHESERASQSYLMSLVALIAGLPLPIVNLLATFFFYLANRKRSYFVRWHCTQALLSQVTVLLPNTIAFWWTISIIFGSRSVTNEFLAYVITVLALNLIEFIATIYTAIATGKGRHVEWFFVGALTHKLVKA